MDLEAEDLTEIASTPLSSLQLRRLVLRLVATVICIGLIFLVIQSGFIRSAGNQSFLVALPFLLLGVCLVDDVAIFIEYTRSKRLDAEGLQTTVRLKKKFKARVMAYKRQASTSGQLINVYYLVYDFPHGGTYRTSVPKEVFQTLSEGDNLLVRYLDESPNVQRVEKASYHKLSGAHPQ